MLSSAFTRPIWVNREQYFTSKKGKTMNRSFFSLFLHNMLTFVALSAIVFGTFSAAHVQAQDAPQNRLDGDWKNVDPHTRGIDVIVIAGKKIHPFGTCHPKDCDWGVIKAKSFASSVDSADISKLVAKKNSGFDTVEITISLVYFGTLRVDTFTHFTHQSGRADYSEVNYFRRAQSPFAP